jgi:glycosyltransferase involved in cell wall biosynthesis
MPRVSVIIPSYNHEKFVGESIRGVLNQSYRDLELIITDDGSSDGTVDVIKQFTDPRIRLFLFQENQGASIATNNCIENARGEYIAVLTSDDVFLPGKLEKQVKFLDEHPEIGAVFGYAQIIDEEGNDFTDENHFYYSIFKQPNRNRYEWLNHFFYKGNCLCHPSLLIRRECYDTVGLYDPRYAQQPDFDFWIRLCFKYDIQIIPEDLIKFRIRKGEANVSGRRPEVEKRLFPELIEVFRKYLAIETTVELYMIFPEAVKYGKFEDNSLIPFIVARLALDSNYFHPVLQPALQYFGIEVLFDLLSSKDRASLILQTFGFRYNDLLSITGKCDIRNLTEVGNLRVSVNELNRQVTEMSHQLRGLQQRLAEKDDQLTEKDDQLTEKERVLSEATRLLAEKDRLLNWRDERIAALLNSLSWKITSPLRRLGGLFVRRNRMAPEPTIRFEIETKLPDVMRIRNSNRFLVEGWIFGNARLEKVQLIVGAKTFSAEIELFRPDVSVQYRGEDIDLFSMFSGFSVPVIIDPVTQREEHEVVLQAEFRNGKVLSHPLDNIRLEPWQPTEKEFPLPAGISEEELLVICMATFNPSESRFRRQVESIGSQDYGNWICIVADDCSDESVKMSMRRILAEDPRFFFVEHIDNVGFYNNFERCLEYVPHTAKYVALADQDDYWYINKLSECLRKFTDTTQLVYCDMRIVRDDGMVLSNTYWSNRKNYYKTQDIDLLTIANTVTGAASIFRSSLLEKILPFPPRYGDVFHDQWIALMAACNGGIDYVDRALYDYIQSGENIIGHYDFVRLSLLKFVTSSPFFQAFRTNAPNLPFILKVRSLFLYLFMEVRDFYSFVHKEGKHIITLSETALLRKPGVKNASLLRRPLSIWGLLKMRFKIVRERKTTNNIELSLLFSRLMNLIYKWGIPLLRPIGKRVIARNQQMGVSIGIDESIVEYKRKFSGRQILVAPQESCINLLLSRLDPDNFFGGYIGMLNFAKKCSDVGHSVRIILTDQKEIPLADLKKIQNHDESLKPFLTEVKYFTCFSFDQPLRISANDIFVATSWWTAHIAKEAITKTNYSKFIYLAQDYEPVFYEHGGYRVLAEQSYEFDYFPLFSTDILQRYFIEKGIVDEEKAGDYFRNPVLDFGIDRNSFLRERDKKRKLLFYGRPQPHNARNLYPIGCLAIDRAREMGFFSEEDWEVISIGGDIGIQTLPSGIRINHIGKFNMQDYKRLLPEHDVGLALMDSPHPSLLPIEMAAAGLLVVTNSYGIKNQQYFSAISSNIRAVPPYVQSLAEALIELTKVVDNYETRISGSRVNWPHDWDEALPLCTIEKALTAVRGSKKK